MYTKKQLTNLFALIESLKESIENTPALEALVAEAARLQSLNQVLMLGTHQHDHGESQYLFLLPREMKFGNADFESYLQDDYEPELGEFLQVTTMNDVVQITE